MTSKNLMLVLALLLAGLFSTCSKDDGPAPSDEPSFPVPETYSFTRGSESTIDLTVPAIHIGMCMELLDEMYDYEHATDWATEVFPNVSQHAAPGVPRQIADWIDTRLYL